MASRNISSNIRYVKNYCNKSRPFVVFNWAPRHEGMLESGGIAPRILDPGTKCRWVVSFTPWPLYPQGNSSWYPLDRLGGWAPEPILTRWWRENFPDLAGTRTPDLPACSLALYRWPISAPLLMNSTW
jgi:hypothetical protein